MADQLTNDNVIQSSSYYVGSLLDQLVQGNVYQNSSQACVVDFTPPVFAGIVSANVASKGQIRTTWLAGTDVNLPVRYEIYIKELTSTGLFSTSNIVAITDKLQYDIFTMPDGSYLNNGSTYYVGVRAIDGVGNRDNNVLNISVISTGINLVADVYDVNASWSRDSSNNFSLTMWVNKNGQLADQSNSILNTAKYVIYDHLGNLVGMSENNIPASLNGQFHSTPIPSLIEFENTHYLIKATVSIDGADRVKYTPIELRELPYDIGGNLFINSSNQLVGSFWITEDEHVVTANVSVVFYQVYDYAGNAISGMTESNISIDSNGLFNITPVLATSLNQYKEAYSIKVIGTVDGLLHSTYLTLPKKIPAYESKGAFQINALNQWITTFWATADGSLVTGSRLGTANYIVYDSSGTPVAGLSQTGITPDITGKFYGTLVSAILITDLTLYTVKIGIEIDGVERVSYKAVSLLGN